MVRSFLKRIFLRREKEEGEPTVPCPGCGGRGRFEWRRDEALRQWSWDAPCGMCDGRGRIPGSWLSGRAVGAAASSPAIVLRAPATLLGAPGLTPARLE